MLVTVGLIVLGLIVLVFAPAAIALVGIAWEELITRAPREVRVDEAAPAIFGRPPAIPAQDRY